jgi:hypothetical protein
MAEELVVGCRRPHEDYTVRQCVTNGFFTHRAFMTFRLQGRRKPEPGLLHHSDRGSQYASYEYRGHLSIMKMKQSMSRKGNCWEWLPLGYNSPTVRFFRSLKYEQLNYEKLRTKSSAKLSIIDYLAFYNGKWLHSNTVINPRCNMSGIFIGKLSKKVSSFGFPLHFWGMGKIAKSEFYVPEEI